MAQKQNGFMSIYMGPKIKVIVIFQNNCQLTD